MKSIKRNIVFNVIRNGSSLFFPLLSFAYISRVLGADGIGKINFSKVIIEYFLVIAALGIRSYGIREAAKIRDDRERLSRLVQEILIINLCSVCVSYVLLTILMTCIEKFIEYRTCLLIQSSIILFNQIGCEWLYEAIEEYPYITIRTFLFQSFSLLLTFVFVKNAGDYKKYIFIWALCECGNGILNFLILKKYINIRKKYKYRIRDHLPNILSLFVFTFSNNIYANIDIVMLGFMELPYQVGTYSVAIKIIKISTGLITAIGGVFMPRISYYLENGKSERICLIVQKVLDLMFMLAIPMVVGIALLRKEIIFIFCGKEYMGAASALLILVLIGVITPVYTFINQSIFITYKKECYMYMATGVALTSNICFNLVLIPIWHIDGAAIATMLAEILGALTAVFLAHKLVALKGGCKNLLFYVGATIPEAITILISYLIIENIVLRILFSIIAGALFYFATLYILKKEILLEKSEGVFSCIKK